MIKIFKKPFLILSNNLIFIQPLLLIFLLVTTTLTYAAVKTAMTPVVKIVFVLTLFLLLLACLSGWFYINKLGIVSFDENDSKEETVIKAVNNFKKFFEGVGENFLNVLFATVISAGLFTGAGYLLTKYLIHSVGVPSFVFEMNKIMSASTIQEVADFAQNVSDSDKIAFTCWLFAFNIFFGIMNYFCCLYYAVIYFDKVNVFKSLFCCIKFFVLNLPLSIVIMLYTWFLYLFLNLVTVLLGSGSVAFAVMTILLTLYLNYYLITVFGFYYDKTKNNSDNGCKLVG